MNNILFLNAGRRNELITCFRRAMRTMKVSGRLIASDIHPYAPALYAADAQHILPRSRAAQFIPALCDLCRQQKIRLIVPLIDPDLPVLAQHRARIEKTGARVLVSNLKAVKICRDKCATTEFLLTHNFPTPKIFTASQARRAPLPLFIKPRDGSAGINAFRVNTNVERDFFLNYVPNPIIQECVDGTEVTTDVFSGWDAVPIIAVPRRRIRVRSGEVSVGRIERNPRLEALCMAVARKLKTVGPINVQAFVAGESILISEINPRFGGGCPLSIRAGAPLARWAIALMLGQSLPAKPPRLRADLTMLRFDASYFRSEL